MKSVTVASIKRGMNRYYIDGVKVTQAEAEEAEEMNALYMYQAEQGDFAALEKIQFIGRKVVNECE